MVVHDLPIHAAAALHPRPPGRLHDARAATGLGYRLHDLRHLEATLAAMTGASTKEITLRYKHATDDRDAVVAAGLNHYVPAWSGDRTGPLVTAADRWEPSRGARWRANGPDGEPPSEAELLSEQGTEAHPQRDSNPRYRLESCNRA
jgi:hypothetical protein